MPFKGKEDGTSKKKSLNIPYDNVEVKTGEFNPFGEEEIKKAQEMEKPLSPRKILHIKK